MLVKKKMTLPKEVKKLMELITEDGYECYLVGGAVRDSILNRQNKDYDFTTNMPFAILKEKLPKLVVMKENSHRNTAIYKKDKEIYEITMLRGKDIYEDLLYRDFKMNAIAVDKEGNYIDPFSGIEDIYNRKINLVQESGEGFLLDPLRILRAIRQADNLNFEMDENTKKEMMKKKHLLEGVAKERIYNELKTIILSNSIEKYLTEYKKIFFEIIKELKACDGFLGKNDYHIYDVYQHTVKVVQNTKPNLYLRLAALFHDIGKPDTFTLDEKGIGHFLGHPKRSLEIFEEFAKVYKVDKKTTRIVSDLILYHDADLSIKNNKIYNFYKKFDMNQIELLFELKKADILAQNPKYLDRLQTLEKQKEKYLTIRKQLDEITYNGSNIIEMGIKGKEVGEVLEEVKRQIINQQLENKKEEINQYIKKYRNR